MISNSLRPIAAALPASIPVSCLCPSIAYPKTDGRTRVSTHDRDCALQVFLIIFESLIGQTVEAAVPFTYGLLLDIAHKGVDVIEEYPVDESLVRAGRGRKL